MNNKSQDPARSLTVEEKVSQLIMIDIPGLELQDKDREHLSKYAWNGVILFAKNVSDRAGVTALIKDIEKVSPQPVLIAVDQEGGLVDRLRFDDMSLSPGAMALSNTNNIEDTYKAHKIMGEELHDLGIHLDFAPVADVNTNPSNPVIGVRSFGEDPQMAAEHVVSAIKGLRDGGTAPTVKHFPGHGDTTLDSHLALPTIDKSLEELEKTELLPFREAIKENVEAIMTAHITFPALDPKGMPATLSYPILTGLLRERMGYEGVIVTDSLAMRAIADKWGYGEATCLSVEAGADLILALGTYQQHLEAYNGLLDAVRCGRISEERLDQSIARLDKLRLRFQAVPNVNATYNVEEHRAAMAAITDKTVKILKNEDNLLPLSLKDESVLIISPDYLPQSPLGVVNIQTSISSYFTPYHKNVEEIHFNMVSSGPAIYEIAKKASQYDYVVLALYARGCLTDLQAALFTAVCEANHKTVVLSLSGPYLIKDITTTRTAITGFGYGDLSLKAVSKAILGQLS